VRGSHHHNYQGGPAGRPKLQPFQLSWRRSSRPAPQTQRMITHVGRRPADSDHDGLGGKLRRRGVKSSAPLQALGRVT
jgi:hypothetical protein